MVENVVKYGLSFLVGDKVATVASKATTLAITMTVANAVGGPPAAAVAATAWMIDERAQGNWFE